MKMKTKTSYNFDMNYKFNNKEVNLEKYHIHNHMKKTRHHCYFCNTSEKINKIRNVYRIFKNERLAIQQIQ